MRISIPSILSLFFLSIAGCSSPTRPTPSSTPATPTPPPVSTLEAALSVVIDSLGSTEAVVGASDVTADASASVGSGLKYVVDFGDGSVAPTPVARHVYQRAGTFTVKVTVTDSDGKTAIASRQLVAASLLGTFVYSGYHERSRHVEVRRLTISTQAGNSLRGFLAGPHLQDTPVSAVVSAERQIRLALEGEQETMIGTLPSVLSGTDTTWRLTAQGGSMDGESFRFARRVGEPTGPGPDAVLKLRIVGFQTPVAVKDLTPLLLDGSSSRGDGLTYYLEFGDGHVEISPTAERAMHDIGRFHARLTVVDRFGRSDVETEPFGVATLDKVCFYCFWFTGGSGERLSGFRVTSMNGSRITGRLGAFGDQEAFSGTLSLGGDVDIVVESGIRLVGVIEKFEGSSWDAGDFFGVPYASGAEISAGWMRVTVQGGPFNGYTLRYEYRPGPSSR